MEVPLVELEVAVEDDRGELLTTLGRDDFQLLLDGQPVPIQLFQPPAARAGEASPLHLVVYVDPTFLEPGDLPAALDAAAAWLQQDLGESVQVLLVTAEPGLRLHHPPTRDRASLAASLAGVRSLSGNSQATDEFRQIRREIDRLLAEGRESNQRNQDHRVQALLARISAFGAETRREIETAIGRAQRLLTGMAGLPGRKILVQIGGGLPLRGEQVLGDVWNAAFGQGSRWDGESPGAGLGGLEQPRERPQPPDLSPMLLPVAETANRHGVTLYLLDASGQRSADSIAGALGRGLGVQVGGAGGLSGGSGTSVLTAPSLLEEMAEATGGRAVVRSRRFEEGLERVRRDLASHYVLGFSPPSGGSGEYGVEVRLPGAPKGADPRYRRHLRVQSADDAARDRILSTLLLGTEDNPLEVEILARDAPGGRREGLDLTVHLPLANLALVADGRFHVGRISIFAAVGTLSGDPPAVLKAVVPVRISNDELLTALGRPVEYRFEVPGGRRSEGVAVGVRDDFAPVTSTVRLVAGAAAF